MPCFMSPEGRLSRSSWCTIMGFFPFQGKVGGVERVSPNSGDMCLLKDPAGIPHSGQVKEHSSSATGHLTVTANVMGVHSAPAGGKEMHALPGLPG